MNTDHVARSRSLLRLRRAARTASIAVASCSAIAAVMIGSAQSASAYTDFPSGDVGAVSYDRPMITGGERQDTATGAWVRTLSAAGPLVTPTQHAEVITVYYTLQMETVTRDSFGQAHEKVGGWIDVQTRSVSLSGTSLQTARMNGVTFREVADAPGNQVNLFRVRVTVAWSNYFDVLGIRELVPNKFSEYACTRQHSTCDFPLGHVSGEEARR